MIGDKIIVVSLRAKTGIRLLSAMHITYIAGPHWIHYVIQQLHDCADLGPWTAVLWDDDLAPRSHILWSQ